MADRILGGLGSSEGFPDLDSMTVAELQAFWSVLKSPKYSSVACHVDEYFEEEEGLSGTSDLLTSYVYTRVAVIKVRAAGRIEAARRYEAILADIHDRLPQGARWKEVKHA